jgi:hypothetical protein
VPVPLLAHTLARHSRSKNKCARRALCVYDRSEGFCDVTGCVLSAAGNSVRGYLPKTLPDLVLRLTALQGPIPFGPVLRLLGLKPAGHHVAVLSI